MLEQIDLTKKIEKSQYKAVILELELRLGELQRKARELEIPVAIVFEGWDAAGKGTLINRLLLALDPRGFAVYPTNPPNEEECYRPFLWRFWRNTPEKGKIAIFDRSWYGRVLVARIDKLVKKKTWFRAYDEIRSFERQLADGGTLIVKFFLHIDKSTQKKRFKVLEGNPATAWKVTKDDWRHHRQFEKYLQATEEMLAKTDTDFAPWTIVEALDRRFATVKVFKTVIEAIEKAVVRVKMPQIKSANNDSAQATIPGLNSSVLDKVDLSKTLTLKDYENDLDKYQNRMREIEHEIYVKRLPVIIVYEGWDAAGKGGNIKRLVQGMDPRGYEVIPIIAPNDIEKAHHYLWRFWMKLPKAGHIAIFDRSWYGRVMVERIEGFCSEADWKRAFREINEMEQQWVNFGAVLIKFWLHIDKEEQLQRFEARKQNPHKQWKITDEDWRNREKWDQYKLAVDEMLCRTSTSYAPWTIIESNSKWFARIKTLKTVFDAVKSHL
ncbi:phosphate--AMP phosphotransferase [candidate division KSB1 bacterium]|nr:phosphate--AMP phosphotransferase [candidate division KSB1 bacterium]